MGHKGSGQSLKPNRTEWAVEDEAPGGVEEDRRLSRGRAAEVGGGSEAGDRRAPVGAHVLLRNGWAYKRALIER